MIRFLIQRIAVAAALIWIVVTLTFVAIHAAPGDPTQRMVDTRVSPAQYEHVRTLYGLDQPLLIQYGKWLKALTLEADWGVSFQYQQPVVDVLKGRFGPTLLLGGTSLVLGFGLGIALGALAATRPQSIYDRGLRIATLTAYALPSFWLGSMAILLFAARLRWAPPSGMTSPFAAQWPLGTQLVDLASHLVLPALVLALPIAAQISRVVRNGLLDELRKDYVTAARARGLSQRQILGQALRNACTPVIQLAGLWLPLLIGGAVTTEYVFAWPGMGTAIASAIEARDYPLVIGTTIVSSSIVILGTLLADITHAALDPRVRLT